jgi:glycosyltransferase involved in cell wall biosynthesis
MMTQSRIRAMPESGILYDMSEFVAHPVRTGIQRVTFEIAMHWPGTLPLVPVQVAADGRMHRLPPETFPLMAVFFARAPGDPGEALRSLRALPAHPGEEIVPGRIAEFPALLNPEVFYRPARTHFYRHLPPAAADRVFFILYDFLPWLSPMLFAKGVHPGIMDYLCLAREARHVAFISEATRQDYARRIVRRPRPVGPVLPLGGDGLGVAAPAFRREVRRFTALGTVEPRKNHRAILEAFEGLWAEGVDAHLSIAGRLEWVSDDDRRYLERQRDVLPHFNWLTDLSDAGLAQVIRASRATIYASRQEGFGLPPLESLALGVPVITCEGLPSLAMMPGHGQVRLPLPDPEEIRRAVRAFLDDDYAARKTQEVARLHVPTWAGMAAQTAHWVEATVANPAVEWAAPAARLERAA